MDKKDKTKIGKTVASAMCVGVLAMGSLALPTDTITNVRDSSLFQSSVVAAQTFADEVNEFVAEVWASGELKQGYATFAEAMTNVANGETVKLYENIVADQTFTITGKSITIDGQSHTIDNSTWLKNIFTVSADATLTIENLTIDGGADTWEIDYENAVPDSNYALVPLKNFESENRATAQAIKSTGNLIADNLTIQNIYTPNGNTRSGGQSGAGIYVTKGTLKLTNSTFKHIAGQVGGAIYVFGAMSDGLTEYPITSVEIDNCLFENNHSSGRGGALNITNVKTASVTRTNFLGNAATRNNGGAFMIDITTKTWKVDVNETPGNTEDDVSISGVYSEYLGLPNTVISVDNCLFENNWCGNDGFAIENEGAELTIKNSRFIENVGPNTTRGCVGTVSFQVKHHGWVPQLVENCVFDGNIGATTGIGDHASNVEVVVKDTEFKNNDGVTTMLIYNAQVELDGVTFENEKVTNSVIDARSYSSAEEYSSEYSGPSLLVKDTTITGTEGGTDIMVRAYNGDSDKVPFTVTFEGTTQAEIELKDNGEVVINSETHTGSVVLDATATESTVTVAESTTLVGEVTQSTTYTLTMIYPNEIGGEYQNFLYIEEGTVLDSKIIQSLLEEEKDGYVLNWYLDSSKTTPWNYALDKNYTLYGQWEEHTHNENAYIVRNGAIYKACTCGKETEEYIGMTAPTALVYDGTTKTVTLTNTIGATESEYTLRYQKQNAYGVYVMCNGLPKDAGNYKAVLTYGSQKVELFYTIEQATYDVSNLKIDNVTVTYDGQEHSVVATGVPEGVTVSYENNGKTEAGTYIVTVKFTGNANYKDIEDKVVTLTILEQAKEESKVGPLAIGAGAGAVVGGGLGALITALFKRKKKGGDSKRF